MFSFTFLLFVLVFLQTEGRTLVVTRLTVALPLPCHHFLPHLGHLHPPRGNTAIRKL